MNTAIIIPSRLRSTRLDEKAIKLIQGKPMVQWVYEVCLKVEQASTVIIATDHEKIVQEVNNFGGNVLMTSSSHKSGTDRCAEVASQLTDYDYVINVQGDEPFINPEDLDRVIMTLKSNPEIEILTLFHEMHSLEEVQKSSNVKLVKDINDRILYFSRSVIPYDRDEKQPTYLKHIGIYAFKKSTLLKISELTTSALEETEGLEQLRWLEHGFSIYGLEVKKASIGVDTAEDLENAREIAKKIKNEL